ncbi:MAG: hypothetical protein QX196_05920 [Methylococcaceae bacterium]
MTSNTRIKKTIVVLAKSIKHHGYCVAGKDLISKQWVRAVSDENGSALSKEQCKCTNDDWRRQEKPPYPSNLLKKIEIEFLQHAPLLNQPENYVVSDVVWLHKYNIKSNEVLNYLDNPETLWGEADRIAYSLIESNTVSIEQSLYLVKVNQLNLYVTPFNKRRASFIYKNVHYDLSVTDTNFDSILLTNSQNKENILCVSLGENYEGFCYKIVATIF